MCDSFLGEGGGRGLISYSLPHFSSLLETPPCIYAHSQPQPSRWVGIKNLSKSQGFKPIVTLQVYENCPPLFIQLITALISP